MRVRRAREGILMRLSHQISQTILGLGLGLDFIPLLIRVMVILGTY